MKFLLGAPFLLLTLVPRAGAHTASPILPVSEIHAGQTGYGLSDFGGGRGIQKFNVTILGVLKGIGPKMDAIIARLSGCGLEKTGPIAGMSGSPVYLDDRLIGAVAFGWSFSREPIVGITPIGEMLAINGDEGQPQPAPTQTASSFVHTFTKGDFAAALKALAARSFPPPSLSAGWSPLPLPLSGGVPGGSLWDQVFPRDRFLSVPSGASARPGLVPALSPGSGVSAVLVSGDMTLAVTGTVTWSEGGRILAFGHPFTSLGPVAFPMAGARIITTVPSLSDSFKLSQTGPVAGAVTQDRAAGILGSEGPPPPTVPVHVSISSDGGTKAVTFRFAVASNPQLTPLLAAYAVHAALTSQGKAQGPQTIFLKYAIHTSAGTVNYNSVFGGPLAGVQSVSALSLLTNYLMQNEFEPLRIRAIDVDLAQSYGLESSTITEVRPDRPRAHPGDVVEVGVALRRYRGATREVAMKFTVPPQTPPGPLTIFVGDGNSATAFDLSLVPAEPQTLPQLLGLLRRLRPANTVNLLAYRMAGGQLLAGAALPALPPTVESLLGGGAVDGQSLRLSQTRVAQETVVQDEPVSGMFRFVLEVAPRKD